MVTLTASKSQISVHLFIDIDHSCRMSTNCQNLQIFGAIVYTALDLVFAPIQPINKRNVKAQRAFVKNPMSEPNPQGPKSVPLPVPTGEQKTPSESSLTISIRCIKQQIKRIAYSRTSFLVVISQNQEIISQARHFRAASPILWIIHSKSPGTERPTSIRHVGPNVAHCAACCALGRKMPKVSTRGRERLV